ncbi:MAG: NUDIX domain-containing protein, partial [Acidimicrobiales bacterium]
RGPFGGLLVFPGGKVDDADRRHGADEISGARRAATREAEEEAALRLAPDALVPFSYWLPPVEAPRRFSTWFFVASVVDAFPVVLSEAEIHDHVWVAPGEAIRRRNRGEMGLAPPTFTTLWQLGQYPDTQAAVQAARTAEPASFLTRIVTGPDGGLAATVWEGDAAYDDGDLARPGGRRRLLLSEPAWRVEMS